MTRLYNSVDKMSFSYNNQKMMKSNASILCLSCKDVIYFNKSINDSEYKCKKCGNFEGKILKDRYFGRSNEYIMGSILPDDLFTI